MLLLLFLLLYFFLLYYLLSSLLVMLHLVLSSITMFLLMHLLYYLMLLFHVITCYMSLIVLSSLILILFLLLYGIWLILMLLMMSLTFPILSLHHPALLFLSLWPAMLTFTIDLMTSISILLIIVNIIAFITPCPCHITILLLTHTIMYCDQLFHQLSTVPNYYHLSMTCNHVSLFFFVIT